MSNASDNELPSAFVFGLILASVVFINNDPNVRAVEIETATEVCRDHKGIKHLETVAFDVQKAVGECNDGMKFNTPVKGK